MFFKYIRFLKNPPPLPLVSYPPKKISYAPLLLFSFFFTYSPFLFLATIVLLSFVFSPLLIPRPFLSSLSSPLIVICVVSPGGELHAKELISWGCLISFILLWLHFIYLFGGFILYFCFYLSLSFFFSIVLFIHLFCTSVYFIHLFYLYICFVQSNFYAHFILILCFACSCCFTFFNIIYCILEMQNIPILLQSTILHECSELICIHCSFLYHFHSSIHFGFRHILHNLISLFGLFLCNKKSYSFILSRGHRYFYWILIE